ncbi:hypothetical protein [Denitromonas sp.]|uniref:hypothetical protein n=1 Tax=Denitromonas sp. TaxID=2734609 RepID=UPI003A846D64
MLTKIDKKTLTQAAHQGFSDTALQALSTLRRKSEAGYAPWASWECENSSVGKTLRWWLNYPSWLPICASSDHGVHWESRCWPNEIESQFQLFLSWNEKKARLMRERHGRNAIFIPHPWVAYRRAHFSSLPENRVGTIVFFTHSNDKTTPVFESLDRYMDQLSALPAEFQPIVICLSFHDIKKDLHKKLRKYRLPLITAGTTNSTNFVDRFYTITRTFKYACSPTIGSHTFYLIESGIPFFLYGQRPTYFIRGSEAVKDGEQNLRDYGDDEDIEKFNHLRRMLSEPYAQISKEISKTIESYLGIQSKTRDFEVRNELWKSLLANKQAATTIYCQQAAKIVRRALDF